MRKKYEKLEDSCGVFSIDDRVKEAGVVPELPQQGDKHPTPEQLLIRQAVKYLTPKQRAVWEYHNYDRLTQDEIASKLKITHQAVSKHISAAEKRIERYCKANWGAYKLLKSDLGDPE